MHRVVLEIHIRAEIDRCCETPQVIETDVGGMSFDAPSPDHSGWSFRVGGDAGIAAGSKPLPAEVPFAEGGGVVTWGFEEIRECGISCGRDVVDSGFEAIVAGDALKLPPIVDSC